MIDVHKLLEELSTYSSGGPGTTRLAYSGVVLFHDYHSVQTES